MVGGRSVQPRHRLHGAGGRDWRGWHLKAFNERSGTGDPGPSPVNEVFELAETLKRRGPRRCRSRRLGAGTAIATVCTILDLELVAHGGSIGAKPLLPPPVRGSTAALVSITARIETSFLGERTALCGAIAVALHAARTMLLSHSSPG